MNQIKTIIYLWHSYNTLLDLISKIYNNYIYHRFFAIIDVLRMVISFEHNHFIMGSKI